MLAQIWSWPVILIICGVLLAVGGGVVSLSPPDFTTAKICFSLAALIVIPPLGFWIITAKSTNIERIIVSCLVFGSLGAIWTWSMLWLQDREINITDTKISPQGAPPIPSTSQHEPPSTDLEPIKPSEPAQTIHETAKPIPRKAAPPIIKKDIPVTPKEIIPDKPIETAPIEATPLQPKEKIADILIRKYPATDPVLERRPKFFIREWLNVINTVNDTMTKHDLQTVLKVRPRLRDHISENAHLAEAIFTLRCLESEGYMRITETPERIMGLGYPVVYNLEFEFVPERLNEFAEGL